LIEFYFKTATTKQQQHQQSSEEEEINPDLGLIGEELSVKNLFRRKKNRTATGSDVIGTPGWFTKVKMLNWFLRQSYNIN
jgi:hypothetical protein